MEINIYILSAIAMLSSAVAIYLAITRSESYKEVVYHYVNEIEKLEDKTTEAINRLSERSEEITLDSIRKINDNSQIQKISEELQKIIDQQISLNRHIYTLRSEIDRLQKLVSEKDRVIHEKDAILHRKEKQIRRLKNEI